MNYHNRNLSNQASQRQKIPIRATIRKGIWQQIRDYLVLRPRAQRLSAVRDDTSQYDINEILHTHSKSLHTQSGRVNGLKNLKKLEALPAALLKSKLFHLHS